jgi:hypothetical protein
VLGEEHVGVDVGADVTVGFGVSDKGGVGVGISVGVGVCAGSNLFLILYTQTLSKSYLLSEYTIQVRLLIVDNVLFVIEECKTQIVIFRHVITIQFHPISIYITHIRITILDNINIVSVKTVRPSQSGILRESGRYTIRCSAKVRMLRNKIVFIIDGII